jgi:uncharacterized membrane protein
MGDEDERNVDLIKRVVWDPQGNRRYGRVLRAVRGRGSAHGDLLPRLSGALVVAVGGALLLGYLDYGTVAGAVDTLGWALLAYVFLAATWVRDRLGAYYEGDEDLAVEELRARYARGEMDLEAFQRQVDRVYEAGPGFVFEDADETGDDGADDGEGPAGTTPDTTVGDADDPMEILRVRFARGELSEEAYRRRVAALEETSGGDGAAEGAAGGDGSATDRETERT